MGIIAKKSAVSLLALSFLLWQGCGPADSKSAAKASLQTQKTPSRAEAAVAQAEKSGRFLFLLFTGGEEKQLSDLRDTIAQTISALSGKADTVSIDAANPTESDLMRKYGIGNRDLPILLVIAPNGVVAGGFPKSATQEQLRHSVSLSDLMLSVLKALQAQKVALIALQNNSTTQNEESWQGVSDFANDPSYARVVTAIRTDPATTEGREFLKQCQLTAPMKEATVVVLLPPGRIGKVFTGKTTKNDILHALQACSAGSGCCP